MTRPASGSCDGHEPRRAGRAARVALALLLGGGALISGTPAATAADRSYGSGAQRSYPFEMRRPRGTGDRHAAGRDRYSDRYRDPRHYRGGDRYGVDRGYRRSDRYSGERGYRHGERYPGDRGYRRDDRYGQGYRGYDRHGGTPYYDGPRYRGLRDRARDDGYGVSGPYDGRGYGRVPRDGRARAGEPYGGTATPRFDYPSLRRSPGVPPPLRRAPGRH